MLTYKELLKKLEPKLKAIAFKLKGYCQLFDEKDLYQEELMYLWSEFQKGSLEDKTDSYILQGCYFYLRNLLRKNMRKASIISLDQQTDNSDPNPEDFLGLSDNSSDKFLNYLNDKLLAEVIHNNGLNQKEKELLPFLSQGLTLRQIGRQLGISHVGVLKMKESIRLKCLKHLDRF